MKATNMLAAAALLALGLTACKDTNFKKTKDGFPYKVFSAGSGEKIMAGNVVMIHTTTRLADSLLGTSYGRGPQPVTIAKDGPQKDMMAFFLEARKGDSILLLQPVDSILAKNPMLGRDSFLTAQKGKNVETTIKIVDVYKDMESMSAQQRQKDEAAIASYLKSNNIQTKKSPQGVYIQTLQPGNGAAAKPGQVIVVRYTGRLLNGKEFDSNNRPDAPPLEVPLGMGSTVPGFEDGLLQLTKGEKARLIIPSTLAYGAQAPPAIGPNQNLVFDIDVIDIKNGAQAPTMPPALNDTMGRR